MPPHRIRTSALLAGFLVVVLGTWSGDSFGEHPTSNLSKRPDQSRHHALNGVAVPPPAVPPPAVTPAAAAPGAPQAAPPAAIFTPGAVAKFTGTEGVALTFDDGPGDQTLPLLNVLRTWGVKATFCLIGANVREHPDLVQAIVRDGHSLCNHTWVHDLTLGAQSPDAIRSDLQRTNDQIHSAVPGIPIKYFRHPGGNWTPAAVAIAQELGMTSIAWDTDPFDWNTAMYAIGQPMVDHIISAVKQGVQPGSIVLSHDGGGDRTSTVAAYGALLPYLIQDRHLHLVPLPTTEYRQVEAAPRTK